MSRWVDIMEKANERGDMGEVHRAVRAVGGLKQNFATKQPTVKADGSRIQGPEELSQL